MNFFRKLLNRLWTKMVFGLCSFFQPQGQFYIEHWRDGMMLQKHKMPNAITNAGLNHLLATNFYDSDLAIDTWYIGLVDNSGFGAFANADTLASKSWNEFTTYSQGTRVAWVTATASSRAISNPSPSVFDITGTGTVKGIFIAEDNTKSGTSDLLFSTAAFSSNVPVQSADQLKVTYTISG